MKKTDYRISFLLIASLLVSLLLGACQSVSPTEEPEELTPTTIPTAAPTVPASPTMPSGPTETPTSAPSSVPFPTPSPSPSPSPVPSPTPSRTPPPSLAVLASADLVFATFEEPVVDTVPALHSEAVAPDLSNVRIPYVLSRPQLERLARDGFVVSPGVEKEFFTLYEKARYANVPVFVTSDSLLHVYHLLFDETLQAAETDHFIPLLYDLNQALLSRADEVYQALRGTGWEDAALRTVAFFGVAARLLHPSVEVPEYAADLVNAELVLIDDAVGILPSPLFPGLSPGEDYTQYIPRGHYTKSDELKAYFKSMMWYGRMTFRLTTGDPEVGRAETRAALLLVYALRTAEVESRPALEAWADLYNPTVFFVGRSDDLTVIQYGEVMDVIYGDGVTAATLADDALLDAFIEKANKLPPPQILGMVIMITDDVETTTKGLRFMGQRFVPDAYIFGQLISPIVAPLYGRPLPTGLDLLAAMGSERAYQILDGMGETSLENYPQQMEEVRQWLSGLGVEDWTETLNNAWLYSFYPLLEVPSDGYPAFMRSPVWLDKQLNTVLGSWAELKHDTILYAKQVYSELGGPPPPPDPVPPRGYVEPVPQFYARLAALTAMTREGLEDRGLLSESNRDSLQRLEDLARSLQEMAEKELRGEPLTEEEYHAISFYGGELELLTMAAAGTDLGAIERYGYMGEEPQAAVIADVATAPTPRLVLEEAVGRINEIHVVVPLIEEDGTITLQVAKGGVFAYYEFPWPMEDRLTDERWRQMLDEGSAPPLPEWTGSFFTSEGEYSDLGMAVARFQQQLIEALWFLASISGPAFSDELQAQLNVQVEALRAENHYVGHLLVSVHFRSFDRQSEDLAVVTVRETWQDSLYEYEGEWPTYWDEEPIARRDPYTLDVAYTLERIQEEREPVWQVTCAVYANEPPDWQPNE
jgi:hypothetical protein